MLARTLQDVFYYPSSSEWDREVVYYLLQFAMICIVAFAITVLMGGVSTDHQLFVPSRILNISAPKIFNSDQMTSEERVQIS